jgi:hypothetical protein
MKSVFHLSRRLSRRLYPALFAVVLMSAMLPITTPAQVDTTIEEINSLLPDSVIDYVEVTGIFVYTGAAAELWANRLEMQTDHRYNWIYHCILVDDGAMPSDLESFQGDSVRVTGHVTTASFYYPYAGDPLVAEIWIDSFTPIVSVPKGPHHPPGAPEPPSGFQTDCDSCKFALIVSGFNSPDFWNNVKQKYDYKKDTVGLCPENIVVLFKGGSRDASEIPNGTTNGGSFTSGGAFDCNRANIDSAFAYIKRKMKENGCDPAEFQFHSTGHGGGYHTADNQGDNSPSGYSGGRIDTTGDETRKISENDLRFCNPGEFDVDGDGTNDIRVRRIRVLNPPPSYITRAYFDSDGDGTFQQRIGTNSTGPCIDKSVSDWDPPDINRSGSIDSVAWDDVLLLGDGEVLVDDELKSKIEELINGTGLTSSRSRAEFSQCFSGSFVDDLSDVTEETAAACEAGEVSYSSGRGENDFNFYQKYFIDGLANGMSWKDAHDAAKESLQTSSRHQNPVYDGPYETAAEDLLQAPSALVLAQNYPNPFNPVTTIAYFLPSAGAVSLEIFDVLGRRVAVLVDTYQEAGEKAVYWDGTDDGGRTLPSGIYFCRFRAGAASETRKMVLLK